MSTLGMEYLEESTVSPIIDIKDACKSYGSHQVLDGLDFSVYPGTIYGLLGPSGCGKTTLVSCIVGRCELDSGSMVFSLGDLKEIGYMPQELSLHMILSIKEIMRFYGYLYKMEVDEIGKRIKFLSDMLDLPPSHRCVSSLSGGQQRRVSLAVALLHDPKVLILDEPTVGLDPVLSKHLWDVLREMSIRGKTIVLTTHYIEEARQADTIGLMRNGRMLTQNSPGALLEKHNANCLEDVFLALCYEKAELQKRVNPIEEVSKAKIKNFDKQKRVSISRIKATLLKNYYISKRNIMMSMYTLFLPVIMEFCSQMAFAHDPYNLPLAIVNQEFEGSLQNCPRQFTNSCILEMENNLMASCVFINELRHRTYLMTEYTNYEDALADHRRNLNRGILLFPRNFTKATSERILLGMDGASDDLLKSSSIETILDSTEQAIRDQMKKDIAQSFLKMMDQTVEICTDLVQPGALKGPVNIMEPIYGNKDWNFFVGFQIGLNTIGVLFCSMMFSAATILDEKKEGSLDRILSAGVSMWDIMIGHFIQHSITAIFYSLELYFMMYHMYGSPLGGSPYLIMSVFFITGLTGVFIGGTLGLITDHLMVAVNAASGFNFAFVCLTGLIWPIEGAHESIRWFLPYVPVTSTIKTVRDIAIKGYGLATPMVAKGFAQVLFWMVTSLILEIIIIKTRKGAWNVKK